MHVRLHGCLVKFCHCPYFLPQKTNRKNKKKMYLKLCVKLVGPSFLGDAPLAACDTTTVKQPSPNRALPRKSRVRHALSSNANTALRVTRDAPSEKRASAVSILRGAQ